ncbi:3-dehydroquinate synthase [Candidatus Fermentibacteria bacterium]|nr:3-dehydroquinate synthase [Candidatus Fermentibacteria bacterium]
MGAEESAPGIGDGPNMPFERSVVVRRHPFETYQVMLGHLAPGWSHRIPCLARCRGNALLVMDAHLPPEVRGAIEEEIGGCFGSRLSVDSIPGGESLKQLEALSGVYDACGRAGIRRDGVILAAGGGTISDLTGFAAATWHRGTPWVVLPTTLLAQVDSSIGGKVGVNIHGLKNQVGAFHQPRAVVADMGWLRHLPAAELACGMAEVVKYALGFDPYLWEILGAMEGPLAYSCPHVSLIVGRCVDIKARCVAFDERDEGVRHLLNLGHTFAHVLEGEGICATHGVAVGLGLVAATRLGIRLGLCDPSLERAVVDVVRKFGLSAWVEAPPPDLFSAWQSDKKHTHGGWVVVVPTGRGSCRVVRDPPADAVREAFQSLFAGG